MYERDPRLDREPERGSTLLMAVFVLFLVSAMGVALLFLTDTDTRMGRADHKSKQAYYLAEAGLEDARTTLHALNLASADTKLFTEELLGITGVNPDIDFVDNNLVPTWDGAGVVTGFTGFSDDVPLRAMTQLGDGWYAGFMTNDPEDGLTSTTDTNGLVMITGIGAGTDGSMEVVQALIQHVDLFPVLPAAITILGEPGCNPGTDCASFQGGSSTPKLYNGNDGDPHCPGGDPSVSVPVIGVIGPDSATDAQAGVIKPGSYVSTAGTVADLTTDPSLESMWTSCDEMVEFAKLARDYADVVGDSTLPEGSLGTPGDPKLVFIDGDYNVSGSVTGAGMLFCTGELTMNGGAEWYGPIFVVGKGDFIRDGGGSGDLLGGVVTADVAGPDRVLFTSDDCSGEDGVSGNSDDGFAQATYDVPGAGTSTTAYCSTYFTTWQSKRPLAIAAFRQM